MLLGEYEHTLDDKNRLTLPAKFRQAFAGEVVVSRGLDGCLFVFTRENWDSFVAAQLEALNPFSKEARQMSRYMFAGAAETELDKQGRMMVPPSLLGHAGLGREVVVAGVRDHVEIWDRAAWKKQLEEVEGVWSLLPSALQRSRTDHVPVLADEVRQLLAVKTGETVVDATFGAGGHARVLAADLQGKGRFIAIDRDSTVRPYFERFEREAGVQARFLRGELSVVLSQLGANGVEADAILIDLGVSSMQIDRPERGFSYAVDAPLDMRMDPSGELSAKELVNEWQERDLQTIFRRYGEERFARQIAQAIVRRRQEKPFERTGELVDVVKSSIPAPRRFGDGHPAKRVFQALRIAVNEELDSLERALPAALQTLRPGGRLAVISFHSLEDRMVKRFFAAQARGCTCPPELPVCVCGNEPTMRLGTRKAVRPSPHETAENPRSASAKLRVAIKVGED